MENIINYENLRSFAYVNDTICQKPVKGIAISFFLDWAVWQCLIMIFRRGVLCRKRYFVCGAVQ